MLSVLIILSNCESSAVRARVLRVLKTLLEKYANQVQKADLMKIRQCVENRCHDVCQSVQMLAISTSLEMENC